MKRPNALPVALGVVGLLAGAVVYMYLFRPTTWQGFAFVAVVIAGPLIWWSVSPPVTESGGGDLAWLRGQLAGSLRGAAVLAIVGTLMAFLFTGGTFVSQAINVPIPQLLAFIVIVFSPMLALPTAYLYLWWEVGLRRTLIWLAFYLLVWLPICYAITFGVLGAVGRG